MSIQAMKQALDVSMDALRAAIEAAEKQEPVGYVRAYALEHLSKPGHTVINHEPLSDDDIALYASVQPVTDAYELGKKDGWEACEVCHGIVNGETQQPNIPEAAEKQEPVAWMGEYNINDIRDHYTVVMRHKTDFDKLPERLRPLYTTPQPAIPAGYALVPVEPTREMVNAGEEAIFYAGRKEAEFKKKIVGDAPLMAFCETFYAKAQAAALRDAADLVHDDYGCDVDSAAKLRRMADELEHKT